MAKRTTKEAKAELDKEVGEALDAVKDAGAAVADAAGEVKDGLVAFVHFVEAGSMAILDTVYEIKDGIVSILPEHIKYAEWHGLKRKE